MKRSGRPACRQAGRIYSMALSDAERAELDFIRQALGLDSYAGTIRALISDGYRALRPASAQAESKIVQS